VPGDLTPRRQLVILLMLRRFDRLIANLSLRARGVREISRIPE
jgi:hypothetical protein